MIDADKLTEFLLTEAKDPTRPLLCVGETVGYWRVLSFLGGGGFGEVYRVEHVHVGIVCALKILKNNTETTRNRFRKEFTFVAQHNGSGYPQFFEIGITKDERPYFVMEILSPRELPSSGRKIAKLLKNLCRIVDALHKEGYIHRDIKPANILYRENGEVVLVDYGLIKKVNCNDAQHVAPDSLTRANVAVGSERYAAPEQLTGKSIDCHADIHALGVLIDTCFHGQMPWRWKRIVCRATSSLSEQRYSSCSALSRAMTWRFTHELVIVLCFMAILITIFFSLVRPSKNHRGNETLPKGNKETNIERSIDAKNISDGAGEWVLP